MKTIRLLTLASFFAAANAHAQWVVYDPTVHTQQIVDQAQNIAKYVEMINNQIEQINTLTSQLQELEKYNEAFGNPARLLDIAGVNGLVRDLRRPSNKSAGLPRGRMRSPMMPVGFITASGARSEPPLAPRSNAKKRFTATTLRSNGARKTTPTLSATCANAALP
jgi:hypothetical protein